MLIIFARAFLWCQKLVCHMSALFMYKFYMNFVLVKPDCNSAILQYANVWHYFSLYRFILCGKNCHPAETDTEKCCTKNSDSSDHNP